MTKLTPPYEVILNAARILRKHTGGDQNDVLDCQEVAAFLEGLARAQMLAEDEMEKLRELERQTGMTI